MGLRDLLNDDQPLSIERFLLLLVGSVGGDEEVGERRDRDVYRGARKRRRRLAVLAFAAGPLVGVANQLADLYCETAIVCDVAAHRGLALEDEEVAAHMLVLWGILDNLEAASGAIGGEPPVATVLAGKLRDRAGEQMPEKLTKRSVTKALWDARAQLGDARKGATSGAVRNVMFTGHRTKQVIARAEAQLGVEPERKSRWRRSCGREARTRTHKLGFGHTSGWGSSPISYASQARGDGI